MEFRILTTTVVAILLVNLISNALSISIKKCDGQKSNLIVVPDAHQCGGVGELVEFRKSQHPNVVTEKGLTVEIVLIAKKDRTGLNLKLFRSVNGAPYVAVGVAPVPDSAIKAGTKYIISNTMDIDSSLKGKTVKNMVHALDQTDSSLSVCVEFESHMV